MKARESTKKTKDCQFIGEKGQGFYSVFRIAQEAIILSGQSHYYERLGNLLVPHPNGNAQLSLFQGEEFNTNSLTLKYPVGGYFFKLSRKACEDCGFKSEFP